MLLLASGFRFVNRSFVCSAQPGSFFFFEKELSRNSRGQNTYQQMRGASRQTPELLLPGQGSSSTLRQGSS